MQPHNAFQSRCWPGEDGTCVDGLQKVMVMSSWRAVPPACESEVSQWSCPRDKLVGLEELLSHLGCWKLVVSQERDEFGVSVE